MIEASNLAAVIFLGLSAGALLTEGAVLVPWWRSQEPAEFLAWYPKHESLLLRFFGPLEVLAFVAAALAAVATRSGAGATPVWLMGASVLALGVLAAFPLYFKTANASFARGTIAPADLASELGRWARWHWARTIVATAAFACAAIAASGVA